MPLDEATARRLAEQAVEMAGGTRHVHDNPRHPFAPQASRTFTLEGERVTVHFGEISSPAYVEVAGYVFEILPDELRLLFAPPTTR